MKNRDDERRDVPPSDELDAVLRGWRARQVSDPAAEAALAERVQAAIRAGGMFGVPGACRVSGADRRIERLAWFAAGLAAAVALVLVLRPSGRDGDPAGWPPSVRFAADQIAGKATLVAGMDEAFAGGVAWIVEHDRRVDVGLVPAAVSRDGAPVAVRIVVLTRRGDGAWEQAWQSDVIARDEEVVDVATGSAGAGRLRLWTHPLPDGAIAIDGDLTLGDTAIPLRASYSGVQKPGEPRRVTGDRVGDVEWQVIQTVMPLGPAREDVG